MNNWSLPQCQHILFFLRVQADLFCSAIFQVPAVFPDELCSLHCHRGRPGPTKGHKTVKIEAWRQQWLHSLWELWELDSILRESTGAVWLCLLQRACLLFWEYWEMVIDGAQPHIWCWKNAVLEVPVVFNSAWIWMTHLVFILGQKLGV